MLHKVKNRKQEGFTIIEVLIVLAIAGLILLIVFLAVPALQRNSRNTSRTNDVARISAAVSDWVGNNQGLVFTAGVGNANLTTVLNSAGTLGQYTLTPGTNFLVATGAQPALGAGADNVVIVTGAQCGASGATAAAGSTRQMAVQWQKEAAGANTPVCTNI